MTSAVIEQLATFGPEHCDALDYEQADAYVRELTATHYENFSVVSRLLPAELRGHFAHVYAFCRWADDLGDEVDDPQKGLQLLTWWRQELDLCYDAKPRHPVYIALRRTIEQFDIPRQPFDDLIDAFVQDQTVIRYETWEQVLDYCTRSADPVGRLVLYMLGHRDQQRQRFSDATCTALQLANFWQDVRRDVLERDRIYIPRQVADKHQLDLELMARIIRLDAGNADRASCAACPMPAGLHAILPAYRATLRELVERTWPLFAEGRKLWPLLNGHSGGGRGQIRLFTWGGESILRLIERQDYDTLRTRPRLSRGAKLMLVMRAMLGTWTG